MIDLVIKGYRARLTKYKLIIYEEADKRITNEVAWAIAQYLHKEGFIKKNDFPVEIISPED